MSGARAKAMATPPTMADVIPALSLIHILGDGETPIFPVQIFKVKEGVNYNEEDPNYDLFKLAMRVSAKRLFPNFSFIDAPYNLSLIHICMRSLRQAVCVSCTSLVWRCSVRRSPLQMPR